MNLPDQQALDDAHWQLDFATQQLAPHLAELQRRLDLPAPTDPKQRERYEAARNLLNTLSYFFTANEGLLKLLSERDAAMNEEMGAANFRYRQMRLERDFATHEAQHANTRYYAENDLFSALLQSTQGNPGTRNGLPALARSSSAPALHGG